MAEKVTITPDGLLVSRWNGETQENDIELMDENDPSAISHLRTYCEIDPDTTLKDIMTLVRKNEGLNLFISMYSWCNSIEEFHAELDKLPVIDENDSMDHMEIRWATFYNKSRNYTDFGLSAEFIGVGLPLKEERDGLPVGFIETFSISGSPIEQFAHLKVHLNPKVEIHRIKRHPKIESIKLLSSECSFCLLDILDAIYWEISFHGPPSQRDDFMDEMRELVTDIESGEEQTFTLEETFDKLGIPPRTEDDDIADDETDAHEWDIE